MVAPNDVDDELDDDVRSECSKYGKVEHVAVSVHNEQVHVRVEFAQPAGALQAQRGLNNRWFGGRLITADFAASQ